MVPQRLDDIGPAIDAALASLDARLRGDRASAARDDAVDRGAAGTRALDAVREAADAVRARLAEGSPADEPRSPA